MGYKSYRVINYSHRVLHGAYLYIYIFINVHFYIYIDIHMYIAHFGIDICLQVSRYECVSRHSVYGI